MTRRPVLWLVLAALAAVLSLAGCGSADDETTGTDTPAAETGGGATTGESTGPALKIGLVTDIGGLDDRSFNFLANQGLERAQDELGVQGRVVISRTNSDYVPNLTSLARQDYDLVVAVGFLMAEALDAVAKQFPDTNFAIIDFAQEELASKPKNVRGLLFKEQEAGYLVGYLAGLAVAEEGGANPTVSTVGGQKIPPVDRYIAGFQAGAKAANPDVQSQNAYSQDFVDQAKCKEIALNQIARGSSVVFQVAGQCGLGALNAAKEKNVWGIGVDADQGYLGDHILTSALKKVDVAVFQTIQSVGDGSFSGGENTIFDVASGGVGLGEVSSEVPAGLASQVSEVQDEIASGEITDIPDTIG